MNKELLKAVSLQTGTPAYVFNTDEFRERVDLVKETWGQDIDLCFSIKANPFLLSRLPENIRHIEVCSPGELTICERTGVDMKMVIFSGVNKGYDEIERAVDDGVGVFTAESLLHVEMLDQISREKDQVLPVLLRLTAGSQFGMDEEDFLQVIRNRDQYTNLRFTGIHFFSGTQKKKIKVLEKELTYVSEFIDRLQDEFGFKVENLEYGTGLAVDYFDAQAAETEAARAQEVAGLLQKLSEKVKVTVEMGRFLAAPCGYYFTKVVDSKCNCGIHYAICDGGIHQVKYDGQIQGMQIPVLTHLTDEESEEEPVKWTLCGSLCTVADILTRGVELKNLQIGDVLVFHRTGAYSVMEGMSTFLSRDMPVVAVYSEDKGVEILREKILTDGMNTP